MVLGVVAAQESEGKKSYIATFFNSLRCLFMAAVFLAIFSPTMSYVAAGTALLTLASKDIRSSVPRLLRMRPVQLGLLYLLLVLIGVTYTTATWLEMKAEILAILLPTVLLPLLIPLFNERIWQRRLLLALLASGVLLAIRMTASYFHLYPAAWAHHFFLFKVHYVQQGSAVVALGVYLALYLSLGAATKKKQVVYMGLAACMVIVLLAFQGERVGMILSFCAPLFFFMQYLRKLKWLLLLALGYGLLAFSIYQLSPQTKYQIREAVASAHSINAASTVKTTELPQTGVALRWHMSIMGLKVAMMKPFFGFGTGSFSLHHKSVQKLPGYPAFESALSQKTPEASIIFVLMRHGIVGVLIFMAYLFMWWWISRPLGFRQSTLVFATLFILVLADCSFPAFYHSRAWIWLFVILMAVLGRLFQRKTEA